MPIRRSSTLFVWFIAPVAASAVAARAVAEDSFYRVPLAELKLIEGELPSQDEYRYDWRARERIEAMQPSVSLDGRGEVYFALDSASVRWASPSVLNGEGAVAVRAPAGRDVAGSLYVPKADYSGMVKLRFSIPASAAAKNGAAFYRAKRQHYQALLERGLPGAAWFRHQRHLAREALGQNGKSTEEADEGLPPRRRAGDFEDTFDLYSGGRAIQENLQLDRVLRSTGKDDKAQELVDVASIEGITIDEINWKPLLAEAEPALDPLARAIPADQHALFFPTFAAALALSDEIVRQGTPISRLVFSRSEDELTKDRYERQLCLPLSTLARVLGGQIVDGVAITGSDPYFFAGTDVAVLFETKQPAALKTALLARAGIAAAQEKGAKPISGKTEGLAWSGFLSSDRRVSCYVAQLEGAIVVTNSTAQLARLGQVKRGESRSLAKLDEYRFFRQRYPIGDAEETAFVFLSDATIRRWCGPKWRIAASRRLRDAAVMSEMQARHLDDLVQGKVEEGTIETDLPLASAGPLRLNAYGVRSEIEGSLEFQTPIAELPLERVTKDEAEAYERWRDVYQTNWRWAFDPIGLRLTVKAERLAADLTVMPLILGSDYRSLVEIARGAEIEQLDGDRHDAVAHFILALNRKSEQMQQGASLAAGMVRVDLLDWLGDWVSVYVDDDPEFWQKLASESDLDRAMQYGMSHLDHLPVGVHVAVRNPLKLAAFMTGLRAWIEQVAPRMTVWESHTYRDEPYVSVGPSERAKGTLPDGVGQPHLYYSMSADGLILSFNEKLLQRALDRQIEGREAKKEGKEPQAAARPWLGSSLCFQFDSKLIGMFDALGGENARQTMQVRSWGNLPILNEWHRRYPDRDPVKLHEEFWQTRLVCPGGGQYVWNDDWQTIESTVYGHPGQPKTGPANPLPLRGISGGNFGLTFEKQGLRAQAVIDRHEEPKSP
ncbi:MAG TPA: hypothetical protein VHC22_18830 [Pirellulales bacterium]|nr:hypothetical protein [Pirellulales bacterium]